MRIKEQKTPEMLGRLVARVMNLVERGEECAAQDAYADLRRVFGGCLADDPRLRPFDVFVFELGEYLNNDAKRAMNATTKELILDLYDNEFLDDLGRATGSIEKGVGSGGV